MSFAPDKVRAILFDIDGTLSDTDDRMVQRLASIISPVFLNKDRARRLARWVIMSLESPGNYFYNLADRFALDSFFIRYVHRVSKNKKHKVKEYWLIPGVQEMLEGLRRFPLGIVSARDEQTTLAFLEQFALKEYFDVIVTSQTCHYTKPFPDPLLHAAEELEMPPEVCLMVGDTTVDMRAAKLAGMQSVGVLCGFGREKELKRAGADLILPTTGEISTFFD